VTRLGEFLPIGWFISYIGLLKKFCRIDPLHLGAIVHNLQKNLITLIAKIVISW
jgi:hypothetical protein